MANDIQSTIFNAIDIVIDKKVETIPFDRTVTASILTCTNALTNEYKLSYQGGTFYALASEGVLYKTGQLVYVLIPEGDFSKQKKIIGLASLSKGDYEVTAISANINNYAPVGKQILSKSPVDGFKVNSDQPYSFVTIYDYKKPGESLLEVDQDELNNILKIEGANRFLVEGIFSNALSAQKRKARTGEFGVYCIIAWDTLGEDFDYVQYDFSSKQMMGNPLAYGEVGVLQNYMFPVEDGKEFDHIEQIVFYCKDFVVSDGPNANNSEFSDILLRDLNFYVLKEISAKNGEYSLTVNTPKGITFSKEVEPSVTLEAVANFKKQDVVQSAGIEYFWFVEDPTVQSTSNVNYNVYAGTGWRKIASPSYKSSITIKQENCSAYITKFLCVAVAYESITLKSEVLFYNEKENKIIQIASNSGTTFAHNIGKPELVCTVTDLDGQDLTNNYNFTWSKIQEDGNEILLVRNFEDIQAEIEELDPNSGNYLSQLQQLKIEQSQVTDGVFISENKLIYPIKKIVGSTGKEKIKCAVTTFSNKFVGSAEITLVNGSERLPNAYNIVVKNGNQVFQYSESGISPTSERYQEPQKILPLEAILYAPDGTEIENKGVNSFDVAWQFPADTNNTLIDLNKSVTLNEETGKYDLLISETCHFNIKEEYNTNARDNQILCLVTYRGMKISGSTNFLFTKIGEDGTNGTDVVVKIEPLNNKDQIATLFLDQTENACVLKDDQFYYAAQSNQLVAKLYERGTEITEASSNWSIGKNSPIDLLDRGVLFKNNVSLNVENSAEKQKPFSLIAQAAFSYNQNDYYANYPVPIIQNHELAVTEDNVIGVQPDHYVEKIEPQNTLRSVLYNKDGRNPIYKQNTGVDLLLKGMVCKELIQVEAEVFGGREGNENVQSIDPAISIGDPVIEKNHVFIPIIPSEQFLSGFNNNYVKINLKYNGGFVSTVYLPVHMSYNLYGLASLNGWDGNKIDINEEGAYIMAPQIGAGVKNSDNTFTGIVMGRTTETIQKENREEIIDKVGLLGFKNGRQSIFLDAESGRAEFGLSDSDIDEVVSNISSDDDQKKINKEQKGGRIILDPDGESKIASWRIGRQSLYNINGDTTEAKNLLEKTQSHHNQDALGSIPRDKQGIILSGNPAYISVKGKAFNDEESKESPFAEVRQKSFEVLLDPSQSSVFNIFKHTIEVENSDQYYFEKGTTPDGQPKYDLKITGEKLAKGTFTVSFNGDNECNVKYEFKDYDVLPVLRENTFEFDLDNIAGLPWVYCNFSKPDEDGSSIVFQIKKIPNSTKWEISQIVDSKNNKIDSNWNSFFSYNAFPTAYLDQEGGLNASSLFKDNVYLKLGSVTAFDKKSSPLDKKYKGFDFYLHDGKTLLKGFRGNSNKESYFTFGETGSEKNIDVSFFGKSFYYNTLLENNEASVLNLTQQGSFLGFFDATKESTSAGETISVENLLELLSPEDDFDYYYSKDEKLYRLHPYFSKEDSLIFKEDNKGNKSEVTEEDDIYSKAEYFFGGKKLSSEAITIKEGNKSHSIKIKFNDKNPYQPQKYYVYCYIDNEGNSKRAQGTDKDFPLNSSDEFSPSNHKFVGTSYWNSIDYEGEWVYSAEENYIPTQNLNAPDNSTSEPTIKKDIIFEKFDTTPQTVDGEIVNNQQFFWKLYDEGAIKEHRFFVPDMNYYILKQPLRTESKDNSWRKKFFLYYWNEEEENFNSISLFDIMNNKEKIVKKKSNIALGDMLTAKEGAFLRLNTKDSESSVNRLVSTSLPLDISSKRLSISNNQYRIGPIDPTFKNNVRLDTNVKDPNFTGNNWRLSFSEYSGAIKKDKYLARFSNDLLREQKEGLFFSGANNGNLKTDKRSALFTSYGGIVQNVSISLTKKKNGQTTRYSRSSFINPTDGLTLQSIGNSVRVEAIGTSLLKSTSSSLSLVGGNNGSFCLASNTGSIISNFTSDPVSIQITTPLHLCAVDDNKNRTYRNLYSGAIYARKKKGANEATLPGIATRVTNGSGASIQSCGGDISTNGGNLYTCKGNIYLGGDGSIENVNTITASGNIKASDFLL